MADHTLAGILPPLAHIGSPITARISGDAFLKRRSVTLVSKLQRSGATTMGIQSGLVTAVAGQLQ